jgi:hypothetical protein
VVTPVGDEMSAVAPLERQDLPGLHTDASAVSGRNKRTFYQLTWATLALGVLAAMGGAFVGKGDLGAPRVDVAAVVSAMAFTGMCGITVYLYATRPERVWYQARALAESVKTLAWQYSVGGGEFAVGVSDAESVFARELREILHHIGMTQVDVAIPPSESQVTEPMRTLRNAALPERYDAYLNGRIKKQLTWYSENSRLNARRAKRFIGVALTIQFGGVVAAGFVAFTSFNFDLLGIAAAAAAAIVAWQQAKDYESLSAAYSLTARDLSVILTDATSRARPASSFTNQSWAEFVDTAEQAISREHTIWLARRGVVPRNLSLHRRAGAGAGRGRGDEGPRQPESPPAGDDAAGSS